MDSAYYAPDLFKHKTVLITGGGSGIGKTIAQHFLYYGARVFIASRKPARLEKAIDETPPSLSRRWIACWQVRQQREKWDHARKT